MNGTLLLCRRERFRFAWQLAVLKRRPHCQAKRVQHRLVFIVSRRSDRLGQHDLRLAAEDAVRTGHEAEGLFGRG